VRPRPAEQPGDPRAPLGRPCRASRDLRRRRR
jgi:hypothetical protein